jgi:kynureninase
MLSMIALDAAMDVWDDVDMQVVREKSMALCRHFAELAETRCGGHGLSLAGPREFDRRGSQVSLNCPEGYAVMQALIAHNVVGDFRAPDKIRFGFAPLYTRYVDVWDAADTLARIMDGRLWDTPEFLARKAVT